MQRIQYMKVKINVYVLKDRINGQKDTDIYFNK